MDDDVNAFAIAQRLFGAGCNQRNFAALAIGAGIGCTLVLNGEIYHGSNSAAGKLGHITLVPGGELCECGRRGCLMARRRALHDCRMGTQERRRTDKRRPRRLRRRR
ncbi:ROK family protein [Sinorhizobium medicae]|uniref:ROK family protein n=1 Tax=Sinorhizobium medicae TaxID=110321 RepID=UPI000FD77B96|nr:ROK family protein [Sinorhizobium medicae]MDX0500243.1 ROK family protein [Sinorhizobium medicae]MDX0839671.1 ROK family protein [Sinorhizobium medicae]MDX0899280.1 ROK family protein [Sinorhizobium medicae]MDX0954907.1 ROK family protein [Sinorhizobium medicae]